MSQHTLQIQFSISGEKLNVEYQSDKTPLVQKFIFDLVNDLEVSDYIFLLLSRLKVVFFTELPAKIAFNIEPGFIKDSVPHQVVLYFAQILGTTNAVLRQYQNYHLVAKEFKNMLVYNVDNTLHLSEIYHNICLLRPPNSTFYLNMHSGFDALTRQWTPHVQFLTPEDWVQYILENKINRMFSVNNYYSSILLNNHHLYFPSLANFFGVEFILTDEDDYSMVRVGHYLKAAFAQPECSRFAYAAHIQKPQDVEVGLTHIDYTVCYRSLNQSIYDPTVRKPLTWVMTANSRVPLILNNLVIILYILDLMNTESVYADHQTLYHAVHYQIYKISHLTLLQKLKLQSLWNQWYVAIFSFLKFEILFTLKGVVSVQLHGDLAWSDFFPEIYKGYLHDAEADKLYLSQDHVAILCNQNYSYFESNPVLALALRRCAPFIMYSPLCTLNKYSALNNLAYGSNTELKNLVANYENIFSSPSVQLALTHLKTDLRCCEEEYVQALALPDKKCDFYRLIMLQHESSANETLTNYAQNHSYQIEKILAALMGHKLEFVKEQSSYFNRPYTQQLYLKEQK